MKKAGFSEGLMKSNEGKFKDLKFQRDKNVDLLRNYRLGLQGRKSNFSNLIKCKPIIDKIARYFLVLWDFTLLNEQEKYVAALKNCFGRKNGELR